MSNRLICGILSLLLLAAPLVLSQETTAAPVDQAVANQEKNQPAATPTKDVFFAEPTKESNISKILPPQDIFYFEYIFQPKNDIRKEENTSFDLHEYRLGFDPMLPLENNLFFGLGITYNAYNFRFEVQDTHGSINLHALTFPITLAWIGDEWMFYGRLETGIKSDFHGLNRRDMQVNCTLLAGYLFSPNFLFEFGMAFANDFGDLVPIPLIGLEWKVVPDLLDISMLIPFHARINLHPIADAPEKLVLFAYYELDGDQFRFRYRDIDDEVKEEDAQFTFYRLGLGAEFFAVKGVSFKLTFGMTAEGEYEFRSLPKDKGRIDSTYFLMAGININSELFDF